IRARCLRSARLKQVSSSEDVVNTVLSVLQGSDVVNGEVLVVDGGRTLRCKVRQAGRSSRYSRAARRMPSGHKAGLRHSKMPHQFDALSSGGSGTSSWSGASRIKYESVCSASLSA